MFLREWVVIVLVLGFFCSIALIATYSQVRPRPSPLEKPEIQWITVTLSGAVKHPGEHPCRPGISLKDLLDQVGIASVANRQKIPFKRILFSSQHIEIPQKKIPLSTEEKNSLEEN